jgi:hypothetical protein
MMAKRDGDVVLITQAQQPRSQELDQRQRRYLVTMGIRVVAFILAVSLSPVLPTAWLAVAIVAALILPWIAVCAANAGPTRSTDEASLYEPPEPRALESGRDRVDHR